MTEKVGHHAQLRVMRKQWIEDSKPRQITQEDVEDRDELEILESIEREQAGLDILIFH